MQSYPCSSAQAAEHANHAHAQGGRRAATAWKPRVLSAAQNAAVLALCERIIPATDTPGAAGARVNEFVDDVLARAPDSQRTRFLDGLAWLDARARRETGRLFADATVDEQIALLQPLSADTALTGSDKEGAELFAAAKAMTIAGYYSSEIGMKELGDSGQLFFAEFVGCTHPEHQK